MHGGHCTIGKVEIEITITSVVVFIGLKVDCLFGFAMGNE